MDRVSAKWKKWAIICTIVVAVLGLGYWGVKSLSEGDKQGELVMVVKPVTRGELEVTVRGWGMLQASEEQDALSGADGVIKDIFFEQGQQVSKGQVLATVDAGSLEIEIKAKEIELELERVKLSEAFGVSPDKVADVDPKSALIVRSPISGQVSDLKAQAGTNAPDIICQVVDSSRLRVQALLPKPVFDKVKVGQKTSFIASRFEGIEPGVVTQADPTPIAGQAAYYYEVWIEMRNPGLLRVGDKGTITIHTPTGDVREAAEITAYGTQETVSTPFSGRVKTVFIKDGATVKAGDPILEFEPGDALLDAMRQQLKFRQKLLEVEELRAQLGSLEIVSPLDGVAMYRNINIGQSVGRGVAITRVSNFTEMNLMLRIDEIDVPKIAEGQMADIEIWGPQGRQKVQGVVSKVGVSGNMQDGMSSFNITVGVTNPGFLMPGMGASAYIFVSKKDDVLLCPVEAVYKEDDKWFVDIKDGNARKPVEIEIGVMNDMHAEILSGLTEGQEVVVAMSKDPENGQKGGRDIRIF